MQFVSNGVLSFQDRIILIIEMRCFLIAYEFFSRTRRHECKPNQQYRYT